MQRLMVATMVLSLACGSSGGGTSVPAGTEGGHCLTGGTCYAGLACKSNLCVNLGAAGTGGAIGAGGNSGTGGNSSASAQSNCLPRSGQYKVSVQVASGNCKTPSDSIITDPNISYECGLPVTNSADLCVSTVDEECTFLQTTITSKGTIRWSQDGTTGQGTFERGGASLDAPVCTAIEKLTYTKL